MPIINKIFVGTLSNVRFLYINITIVSIRLRSSSVLDIFNLYSFAVFKVTRTSRIAQRAYLLTLKYRLTSCAFPRNIFITDRSRRKLRDVVILFATSIAFKMTSRPTQQLSLTSFFFFCFALQLSDGGWPHEFRVVCCLLFVCLRIRLMN